MWMEEPAPRISTTRLEQLLATNPKAPDNAASNNAWPMYCDFSIIGGKPQFVTSFKGTTTDVTALTAIKSIDGVSVYPQVGDIFMHVYAAEGAAVAHDVPGFVEQELADRRELGYPPYSRIALVRIDDAEEQVAAQRLEDVLPGADPVRVAHRDGLPRRERGDGVRDDPVPGPVAAADDVAGPGRGHHHAVLGDPPRREEGATPGGRHQLGRPLRHRVDIMAAHGLVLAVAVGPLVVLVALVAGDDDHRTGPTRRPDRLQQVGGAEQDRKSVV
jgi:hypothetical protein